jgi:hypothetical protein
MKYNKIALMVAGGLLVSAAGVSQAAVNGASTSAGLAAAEYGAIRGLSLTATSQAITPDGSTAFNALDGISTMEASLTDTGWCVANNSPTQSNGATPPTVSLTDTTTSATDTVDMGGFSLAITGSALAHSAYALNSSTMAADQSYIDVTYAISSSATSGTDDHHEFIGVSGTCAGGAAGHGVMGLTTTVDDVGTNKYAGDYLGTVDVVLSGATDEA